jgi:hypothetical protein
MRESKSHRIFVNTDFFSQELRGMSRGCHRTQYYVFRRQSVGINNDQYWNFFRPARLPIHMYVCRRACYSEFTVAQHSRLI